MTQEEKQILLQDLCARLPYGVMLNTPNGNNSLLALVSSKKYNTIIEYNDYRGNENNISEWTGGDVELIRPYLRPMFSMTEEESNELESITFPLMEKDWDGNENQSCIRWIDIPKYMDFILSHHFDYQGLIEKGLALEAPEGMYDTKTE